MSTLPRIRTKYGEDIGVELFFSFPDLSSDEKSFLDADSLAGATSITASGINFANTQYVVIGQPGNEKTEIIQISGTPTATNISFNTSLVFPHNRGDLIRFIPYNQIEAQFSTDGVNYSVITPVAIRADSSETYMQRSSDLSTYSYKFRFLNSTTSLYSAFSMVALASGYPDNSLWTCKNKALKQMGEEINDLITDSFLNDSVYEARRIMDQDPKVFRWSFREKFGVVAAQMLSGQWSFSAPTDLRDRNTYKNIISIRFADQNRPVQYQDKRRFNMNYLNVVHATTVGSTAINATSITLSSTHDLPATGSLRVANNSVGDGLITISYTANNKTTNVLSGVTGVSRTISDGTDVWLRATFGLPTGYNISSGTIYTDVPIKVDYDGTDVKMDYYSTIPAMVNDSDTFDEPFYDHYVAYLKYKIKYLKANGKIDQQDDSDYQEWIRGVDMVFRQETPGQRTDFVPDIEGFLSSVE